jgi:hypothetical protein
VCCANSWEANLIGGDVFVLSDLWPSPTMSKTTNNSDNGSMKKSDNGSMKKKTSLNLFFNDSELIENEKKS